MPSHGDVDDGLEGNSSRLGRNERGGHIMTIRNEFAVHMLNAEGKEKAQAIARDFDHLLGNLETVIGPAPSREMSIVKTKLEEACFHAYPVDTPRAMGYV
jgi:hypothetical protein